MLVTFISQTTLTPRVSKVCSLDMCRWIYDVGVAEYANVQGGENRLTVALRTWAGLG